MPWKHIHTGEVVLSIPTHERFSGVWKYYQPPLNEKYRRKNARRKKKK